jgi:leucine dehydrogenase
MKACLRFQGKDPDVSGMRVAVQGLGHVGMDLCRILHTAGATLTVADIDQRRIAEAVETFGAVAVDTKSILQTECDILAPCALGAVIGPDEIRRLQTGIVCGASNNILVDPSRDAIALAEKGVLYAPDFVVNAGGLIWLAGLWLGMDREELDRRNDAIERTTLEILEGAETLPSPFHAALALAERRFAEGPTRGKETVHAG